MSSSDMRIIKDAKISQDPVLIAMHKFAKLDAPALCQSLDSVETHEQSEDDLAYSGVDENSRNSLPRRSPPTQADKLIHEVRTQAEELRVAAEQQVAQMKAQAFEEATELKLKAIEDGKAQGLEEARRQMTETLQQTTEGCNSMMSVALQEARQVVLEADHQIVELVLAIARKIIFDAVEDRPELILGIVKSALVRVKDQSQINIHVSLDDYERVLQSRRELQLIVGAERAIAVTADSMLGPGGCLIETSFGTVEAGIDTQLDSIRKVLQEMLP